MICSKNKQTAKGKFKDVYCSLIAMAYDKMGDVTKAIQYLEKATKHNPENFLAFSMLGKNYKEKTKEFEKAQKAYSKCLELKPNNADALASLSYLLQETGGGGSNSGKKEKKKKSIKYAKKAVKLEPNSKYNQMALANAYQQNGDYENAIKIHRLCIKKYPLDPETHSGLGSCLIVAKQHLEAEKVLTNAVHLDPHNIHGIPRNSS